MNETNKMATSTGRLQRSAGRDCLDVKPLCRPSRPFQSQRPKLELPRRKRKFQFLLRDFGWLETPEGREGDCRAAPVWSGLSCF